MPHNNKSHSLCREVECVRVVFNGVNGTECQVKPAVNKDGRSNGYDQEIIDAIC